MTKLLDLVPHGYDLILKHPVTGEAVDGNPTLSLISRDSKEFKAAARKIAKDREAKQVDSVSIERMERESNDLLVACVSGWSPEEFFGGPFSKEAMVEVLENPGLSWLREQLADALGNRTRFFGQ